MRLRQTLQVSWRLNPHHFLHLGNVTGIAEDTALLRETGVTKTNSCQSMQQTCRPTVATACSFLVFLLLLGQGRAWEWFGDHHRWLPKTKLDSVFSLITSNYSQTWVEAEFLPCKLSAQNLGLGSPVCKMRIPTAPALQDCWRIYWANAWHAVSAQWRSMVYSNPGSSLCPVIPQSWLACWKRCSYAQMTTGSAERLNSSASLWDVFVSSF